MSVSEKYISHCHKRILCHFHFPFYDETIEQNTYFPSFILCEFAALSRLQKSCTFISKLCNVFIKHFNYLSQCLGTILMLEEIVVIIFILQKKPM